MQISFNVVKKRVDEVKVGDLIYGVHKHGFQSILKVGEINEGSFEVSFNEVEWVDRPSLTAAGIINPDGTVNVLERVSDAERARITELNKRFLNKDSGLIRLRLKRIKHLLCGSSFEERETIEFLIREIEDRLHEVDLDVVYESCAHTEIRMGADNAVAGIVFEGETFTRQTAEPEPAPSQNPWERLVEMYPDGVTVRDLREKHGVTFFDGCLSTMLGRKGPVNNPSKRVLDVFESLCDDDKLRFSVCYVLLSVFTKRTEEVEETAHMRFVLQGPQVPFFNLATESPQPTPETRIIPIDGVKHVITRESSGEWGKPVVWGPAVGDEVELGSLKVGDRFLINMVISGIDEDGDRLVKRFDNSWSKFFGKDQKVIYNGRSEA